MAQKPDISFAAQQDATLKVGYNKSTQRNNNQGGYALPNNASKYIGSISVSKIASDPSAISIARMIDPKNAQNIR
ncbi:MAG: hypothetical protein LBH74_07895 [Nitrososphaerota archaeon]|jgi:hypothetical protein|nr:hypothetical protein [Nitrososphaerota archaeon]